MMTSQSFGQGNDRLTILGLVCAKYPRDAKKLVLLHKQGRAINVLSPEAITAFADKGIIELDRKNGPQLKVSPYYEKMLRGLTVSGLTNPDSKKGACAN